MKNAPLTNDVAARICKHMNNDHSKALVTYATHYAGCKPPLQAKMVELNTKEMKLEVDGELIAIAFNHTLVDSEDAHKTLVSMFKVATSST